MVLGLVLLIGWLISLGIVGILLVVGIIMWVTDYFQTKSSICVPNCINTL